MKSLCKTKWILGLMLISSSLMAEDESDSRERIPVGSRALGHAERVAIEEKKFELIQKLEKGNELNDEEKETVAEDEVDAEKNSPDFIKKSTINAATYETTHQGAFHNPIAVSLLGNTVELEDGSIWSVASGDRYQTLDWMTGDLIIILPNHAWFSSYYYRLVNVNTGANVKVNLSLGPIYNGYYTHWITAIDYANREICLEDGSVWKMSSWDNSIISKWLPNDTVIIGINDGWLSGANCNILINVNMNNHSMGRCIFY